MEDEEDVPEDKEVVCPVEHLQCGSEWEGRGGEGRGEERGGEGRGGEGREGEGRSLRSEWRERQESDVLCTSNSPLLLMQGSEQSTMTRRTAIRRTPVRPAVPHTQPTSVPTKRRYCQTG